VLIENAVDVEPFLALASRGRVPGRCVCVGRLSANKGLPELLAAFSAAQRAGARFTLRCVGPDPDGLREEFARLARNAGIAAQVTFTGEVDQAQLLQDYAAAEIFVSASRYEGFGLAAIEARAAGCRLVLEDNDAFRANFADDPAAVLTHFADPERAGADLASALVAGPQDATESGRSMMKRYSWAATLGQWQALYERCLGRTH
jgi:alpha-1,3-mannosyltransferase